MELNFSSKEKKVGLFMFFMLLLLLATILMIGRGKDWFRSYIHYYTIFNESYNLEENAAVKLSKADIGKVRRISLYGERVKVEISVLREYSSRIRTDSLAVVESPTLIGSEYVSIKPGTAGAAPVPENGEIPSKAKKSLDEIMAEFQVEQTARKAVKAIQDLSEIAEIMRDPNGPLFSALNNTNLILAHIENVTRDIRDGKGSVGGIVRSERLLDDLYREMERVDRILGRIEAASPEMIENVRAGLQDARKIISNIEKGSRDVPEVARSAKRGIREAREGVKNIGGVVQSIRNSPFIRPNLPPEPEGDNMDAGLRK
ncbi:MAG: MlaD family protein [Syntrophales bacterium]|nr:MlaD family protein [Syntrophales bacterium]MDD5232369.1 MlaD family protein [Syntrophales bacterium]MDD5532049.1 MlaD family protein [Syntrophales bacterium]